MSINGRVVLTMLILRCATAIPAAACIDTIPPLVERTSRGTCGDTVHAVVTDMPEPPIRSNLSSIDLVPAPESFNIRIDVEPFEDGVAPVASYSLAVFDRTKDARAIVRIYDKAGNVTYDTVSYTAIDVVAEPGLLSFGNLITGTRSGKKITLENRSFRRVGIVAIRLLKGNAGFSLVAPTTGFELDSARLPGARRDVFIQFDATAAGTHVDTLRLEDECGLRHSIVVVANVGAPIIAVTDHDFGAWPITAPPSVDGIEIRNDSRDGAMLTVTGIAQDINDKVTFTLPDGLPTFPFGVAAGESRVLRVTFAPGAVRQYLDSIVFEHNAPPNQANDATGILRGRGFQPPLGVTSDDRDGDVAGMSLRPNPAGGDDVLIALDGNGPSTIRLTSLTGEILRTLEAPAGATVARLDVRGLATGSYLVSLTSHGRCDVRRLVIKR
jgi:hypothetical protein